MVKQIDKNEARLRRHRRVRNKISGTAARPRLDVFRSAKHIYAQIIDDEQGVTLVSASTMDKDFNGFGGNVEAAAEIGKKIAAKALEKENNFHTHTCHQANNALRNGERLAVGRRVPLIIRFLNQGIFYFAQTP